MCITYSVMLIYESVYNKLGKFHAATLKQPGGSIPSKPTGEANQSCTRCYR